VGKLKERNHLEDSGVEGRIILEWFLQIENGWVRMQNGF